MKRCTGLNGIQNYIFCVLIIVQSCTPNASTEIEEPTSPNIVEQMNVDSALVEVNDTFQCTDFFVQTFDSTLFHEVQIDFDNDRDLDRLFYYKHLMGDSLFVYENKEGIYDVSLKTINFSDDGLYVIESISAISDRALGHVGIYTYFNGSGGMRVNHFLKYNRKNGWKLNYTVFESSNCDGDNNCIETTCNVYQNLDLNDSTDWNNYRDQFEVKDDECVERKFRLYE